MSYMRGHLLTKTWKPVKGLANPAPAWLKAMEQIRSIRVLLWSFDGLITVGDSVNKIPSIIGTFLQGTSSHVPSHSWKIKKIEMPEDIYLKRFFKKHPDSLYHDAVKISGFDPPPARVFAWRVLELKDQGIDEDDAVAVADMEYRTKKKAKKKAYKELKGIARSEGKRPPPNPYPSAIKEIQAEEKKYVRDRFFNPKVLEIVNKMKEERQMFLQDRAAASGEWP